MSSRFAALTAGRAEYPGEAVLWRQDATGRTAAVDVGATDMMGAQVAAAEPDIVILTHDDHDHIGGFGGFSDFGPWRRLGSFQLWLPYEWVLLADTALALAHARSFEGDSEALSTNQIVGVLDEQYVLSGIDRHPGHELDALLDAAADLGDQRLPDRILDPLTTILSRSRRRGDTRSPADAATRAVRRSRAILRILRSARNLNAEIRLFSVDHARDTPWTHTGAPGLVTIPNAAEMEYRPQRARADVAYFAALSLLTIQNHRALTALLWDSEEPTAMIWSDSPGDWCTNTPIPVDQVRLTTAPHHGSDRCAHDPAWQQIARMRDDTVHVLSGGSPNQKTLVHSDFFSRSNHQRACTRCRHAMQTPSVSTVHAHVDPHGATLRSRHCVV